MSYASLFSDLTTSATRTGGPMAVSGLSSEQLQALHSPSSQGAVICAGAGAGKTKLLVERVAALLKTGVPAQRIAVVAFTRKSAAEIIARLKVKLGPKAGMPICSTIDALSYGTLRGKGAALTLATPEQEADCLECVRAMLPAGLEKLSDRELLLLVNRAREDFDSHTPMGLLGMAYSEQLAEQGLNDFTTLLEQASATPRDSFDHVIVDEAQDLSQLQLKFLLAVAVRAAFWFIGDADQAIYSFRGARSGMMQHLRGLVPNLHLLTTNYRSAQDILAHANRVIRNNPRDFPIDWVPARPVFGNVRQVAFANAADEVSSTIAWLAAKPKTRCALARTQAMVAPYKALGLPGYTVHEAKGLEWPEVRVLGCEEGLFPHPLSGAQEERRLFYVAMTRARDVLELSYCKRRSESSRKPRTPSRFFVESEVAPVTTALPDKSIA